MTKIANPPAFARLFADNGRGDYSTDQEGMTLRDYFAGQVAAALAEMTFRAAHDEKASPVKAAATLARTAYMIADHMLIERQKD